MRPHHLLLPLLGLLLPLTHATKYDPKACNNHPSLCALPYSQVTYLGTHNAPMLRNHRTGFSVSGNQYFNTTIQLSSGVRLLQAQIHSYTPKDEDEQDMHVCHSRCSLLDGGTFVDWLEEIKDWMDKNPSEVVTLLLINEGDFPLGDVAAKLKKSGIDKLAYDPPADVGLSKFPTLGEMVSSEKRLVVFVTDGATTEDTPPYLLHQWDYIWENPYQHYFGENATFSCGIDRPTLLKPNENASAIKKASEKGMGMLFNGFLYRRGSFYESPYEDGVADTNGRMLGASIDECIQRGWKGEVTKPTFVLVDFYNEGDAMGVVDGLNGIKKGEVVNRIAPPRSPKRGEPDPEEEDLRISSGGGGGGTERIDLLVNRVKEGGRASWGDFVMAAGDWGRGIYI